MQNFYTLSARSLMEKKKTELAYVQVFQEGKFLT